MDKSTQIKMDIFTDSLNQKETDPSKLLCKEIFTIDPGISNGSIAREICNHITIWKMNEFSEFEKLVDFWGEQKKVCLNPVVFLEKITSFKDDFDNGPRNKEQQNAFVGRARRFDKLKTHYAELRAALKVNKIPFIEVFPYHWQKYLNIHISGEDYNTRKKRFKDIALHIYPHLNVTLQNCDSLLLIRFAKKKLLYDFTWVYRNINK